MRRNNFLKAAQELKIAYNWHSREVNNNYELGNAYAKLEDFANAEWAYREALKANGGYDEIYFNLAVIMARKRDKWKESVPYMETSLLINPLNPPVYLFLAKVFTKFPQDYAARGVEISKQAVSLFPLESAHYNNLGWFSAFVKDYKSALDAYSAGLLLDPDNAMIEANLRRLAAEAGNVAVPALEWKRGYAEFIARVGRSDFSDATLNLGRSAARKSPDNINIRLMLAKIFSSSSFFFNASLQRRYVTNRRPDSHKKIILIINSSIGKLVKA